MPMILRPPTDQPDSLTDTLGQLGRVRRRVAVAAGVFALVAVAAAGALVTCALDAWLVLPALARAFGLTLTLAAAGVCWLRVRKASRLSSRPIDVALELEGRHPRLNDALASAVCFIGEDEDDEDAPPRRRTRLESAAIHRAEKLAEKIDFGPFVPVGRFWQAFWACAFVAVFAIPLALWNTDRAEVALVRFADPFGSHPWPTKTRIEVLSPQAFPARMPKGDTFELQFAVRGVVPDRATVTIRHAGGGEFEESYPLNVGNDTKYPNAAVVVAPFDPARVPVNFNVRVRAGDADTGWHAVAVVPPPKLVPLNGRASPQIHVAPPEYTGVKAGDLPDGTGVVEVPVGSRVTMKAATDVRVASASLVFVGDRGGIALTPPLAPVGFLNPLSAVAGQMLGEAVGSDIPVSLSSDGRILDAAFTPAMSGMYALKMADETGLTGTRLLEIRVTPDPLPMVTLVTPAPGRDPSVLTPDASVTIVVAAEDKVYALNRSFVEYRVGREGRVRIIPLMDVERTGELLPTVGGGLAGAFRPQPSVLESGLKLPLSAFLRDDGTPVKDGDTLIIRGAAEDWDDVTVCKQPGRSSEFEIKVSSRESVEAHLQKELAALRPEIQRARDQQREAQQKTASATTLADGTLSAEDREKLLAAEQIQRQLRGKIADTRDGLRQKADLLRDTARANALPKSNTTTRVEAVAEELGHLTDRDLAAVEPLIAEARQQSTTPPKTGQQSPVPGLLSRADRHQKAVDEGLTNILDVLSQWGGAGQVRGEARVLRDNVKREAANTEAIPEKVTPGKAPADLTPQQRQELDKLAGKLDLLGEAATQLLGRAGKFAAEKEAAAAEAKAAAAAKDEEAAELRKKAAASPPGSDDEKQARARADAAREAAAELNRAAERAEAEAAALRRAESAAGGQSLPDELRRAADAARNNRPGEAANQERSAAARLDRFADSLTEKQDDSVPELKKLKKLADKLDALAAEQDDLNKKIDDAAKTENAADREAALKKLVPEQERLIEKNKDLVQQLTREKSDAARDARQAGDRMEATRDDLEQGKAPARTQTETVEKLDNARDRLDATQQPPARQLSEEKRRKLFDAVKALLERQKAATAEAARVQEKVLAAKKWERSLLASYADLEASERALAVEVRNLSEREFTDLPVFARMLKDAAAAMEKAADRAKDRREDADPTLPFDPVLEKVKDDGVRRPMQLAQRRLEQLMDAVKPDDPKVDVAKKDGGPKKGGGGAGGGSGGGGGGDGDVVPPLAQLKALRALQAELNERTAEFAKAHPDPKKLEPDERDELKELEEAQREITELFEKMARMFQKQTDGEKP